MAGLDDSGLVQLALLLIAVGALAGFLAGLDHRVIPYERKTL
jgi:hypothetical protein